MGALVPTLFFVLAAASMLLVAIGIRLLLADRQLGERIAFETQTRPHNDKPGQWQLPRIFAARGRDREEIEQKLKSAGYFDASAVDQFVKLRLVLALVVACLGMLGSFLAAGDPFHHWLAILTSTWLAYIGPKYLLKWRAAERESTLTAEFPFLLDLMLMMLESGVSLDQCFRSIAREEQTAIPHHAPLIAMLVDDLDRGQDYQTAFDRWAARVGVNGAKEIAGLFRQSLFQGMELIPALREFIVEFSHRRIARAREAIGKITVRMVVLMLVFFMPALFIVLAGPPVAAIFDTLMGTKP